MPRNYSKQKVTKKKASATTKAPASKGSSGFIYLGVGLIIGLFVAFLVYLDNQPEGKTNNLAHPATKHSTKHATKHSTNKVKNKSLAKKAKTAKKNVKKQAPKKKVPKYEFYTMLPDVEIEVDVPEPLKPIKHKPIKHKQTKSTKQKTVTSKKTSSAQAKTKSTAQAKTTKKTRTLIKKTLYQLQVGAFASKQKAESMKAQLGFMGVQSSLSSSLLSNGKKVYKVKIGPTSDEKNLKLIKAKLNKMHIKTFLQKG